jgi:hypothetical protein
MLMTDAFNITYKGEPAKLYVMRNDGYCWGRVVTKDGEELDAITRKDYYDQEDEVAAVAFERAAKRGNVESAAGWLLNDEDA